MGSVQNTKFRFRLLGVEKTRQGSVKLELFLGGDKFLSDIAVISLKIYGFLSLP